MTFKQLTGFVLFLLILIGGITYFQYKQDAEARKEREAFRSKKEA